MRAICLFYARLIYIIYFYWISDTNTLFANVWLFAFDTRLLLTILLVFVFNRNITQMYQFIAPSIVTSDRPREYSSTVFRSQLPGENPPPAIIIYQRRWRSVEIFNASYKPMDRFIERIHRRARATTETLVCGIINQRSRDSSFSIIFEIYVRDTLYYLFRINNTTLCIIVRFVKL